MRVRAKTVSFGSLVTVLAAVGCGADEAPGNGDDTRSRPVLVAGTGAPAPSAPATPTPSNSVGLGGSAAAPLPMNTPRPTPPAATPAGMPTPTPAPAAPPAAKPPAPAPGAPAPAAPPAAAPAAPPAAPAAAAGPNDGDPSQPIVAVQGVTCGPNPSLFGLTSTNVKIGGRDVHVAYPCNKHKGAPVTFILNLHGTMPEETLKLYQVAYFSANNLVDSHNFITAAPKSVVSQWGNGDNGVDEPHIMAVIDWVYTTFKDFDIRSMWIGGHSWGAMYTSQFGCKASVAEKVRGLILMSGNPIMPACAGKLAVIGTIAENDIAGPLEQGAIPMSHGCGAPKDTMIGNNKWTLWPECQKGFVHSNYFMFGKAHADYMDAEVVKSIADQINLARP